MELNKKICSISSKELKTEGASEHTVESEITLPEYFPDIVSVLKYTLTPNINSSKISAGKITVEGNSVIRIIYICEEKKIHCFEQRVPFTKTIEVADIDNSCAVTDAKTEYINCRVISQRKLSIHSGISFSYKLYCRRSDNLVSGCECESVQMKKCKNDATVLRECSVKYFNLNETMELGTAQESIGQIVRSEAVAILDSAKIVSGKILIKGELKAKIVYITEKTFELEKTECTMPISQIVEVDSGEDSIDYITLCVTGVDVFAKTDSSGALRMFDLTACVRAEINIYDDIAVDCICDSYSTENELELSRKKVVFEKMCEKFNESYLCRGTVEFGEGKIKSILDLNCTHISSKTEFSGNELSVFGTISVAALILREDNEMISVEREFEYKYQRPISNTNDEMQCRADATVSTMNFVIIEENKIDIRTELEINGVIFTKSEREYICDLSLIEDKRKARKTAPLTIYFSEKGENVWNIAKRYNTTVEAITKENSLKDEEIKEKCKLLIPCK